MAGIEALRIEAYQFAEEWQARAASAGATPTHKEAAEATRYIIAFAERKAKTMPSEWLRLTRQSREAWSRKREEDAWAEACQHLSEIASLCKQDLA